MVSQARAALGHLLMRLPRRLTDLSQVRVIGPWLHHISQALLSPESRIWVRIRSGPGEGLWMSVNPRTGGRLYCGSHEPAVQRALLTYLRPGMVFYDLGANTGLFTLIGARCVGMEGKVHAFEPDPEVCQRLRDNVLRNSYSNVVVVQSAIGSRKGLADFVRVDPSVSPDRGLGRLGTASNGAETIRVRSISLDEYVKRAPPPDVLKCDVEGAERDVLDGARSLVERTRPIIVCETHSEGGAVEVEGWFVAANYRTRWIDDTHLLALPRT